MKKIIFRNPRENFDFEKLKGKETLIILPSQSAINFYIREMLKKGLDISKTEFETFDGIGKKNREKRPDEILKYLVLSKILKKNFGDIPVYPETVDLVLDFFDEICENNLNADDIKEIPGEIFNILSKVFEIYESYFSDKSYDIYGKVKKSSIISSKFDSIIISGFLEFGKTEEEIIRILSEIEDKNIYIDMPFNFIKSELIEATIKKLLEFSFELERGKFLDYKEEIDKDKIKIFSSKNNFYNLFFSELKLLLEDEDSNNVTVLSGSSSLSEKIRSREKFEGLEFSLPRHENFILKSEFLSLLDYFSDRSKENTLKRVRLSFFPMDLDEIKLESALMSYDFKDLYDIDFSNIKEFRINDGDLKDFLLGSKILQDEKINKKDSIDYYRDFFGEYLEKARQIIESELEKNPESLIRRELRFLEKLDEIFLKMDSLLVFYKTIDLDEFILILKKYLEMAKIPQVQNLDALEISKQSSNYYRSFKNLILIGFDENYENNKKSNFIYKRESQSAMEKMGLIKDNFKRDYIYLLYDFFTAENILIICGDKEKGYSKLLNSIIYDLNLEVQEKEKIYETSKLYRREEVEEENYHVDFLNLTEINKKISARSYSVTDFDVLKDCPRRFLFERVYGLGRLEKDYDEKFYINMGDKYHHILEKYFKAESGFNEDKLRELILEEENLGNFENLSFINKVSVLNSQKILGEYIKKDLEVQEKYGFKPKYFEESFMTDVRGLKIKGRIDRIDARGDEEILMDYKRSSVKTKKEIEDLKSFQMPLYAIARRKVGKKLSMANYGSIKKGEISTVIKNSDILAKDDRGRYYFTEEEIQELLNRVEDEIISITDSIKSGNYESTSDCKICDYLEICENKEKFNG